MSFPVWPNIRLCAFSIEGEGVSAIEVQLRPF